MIFGIPLRFLIGFCNGFASHRAFLQPQFYTRMTRYLNIYFTACTYFIFSVDNQETEHPGSEAAWGATQLQCYAETSAKIQPQSWN